MRALKYDRQSLRSSGDLQHLGPSRTPYDQWWAMHVRRANMPNFKRMRDEDD